MSKTSSIISKNNNTLSSKNINTIKEIFCSVLIIVLLYYIIKYIASITVSNNMPTIENFNSSLFNNVPLLSIGIDGNDSNSPNIKYQNFQINQNVNMQSLSSSTNSNRMFCINNDMQQNPSTISLCEMKREPTYDNSNNISFICVNADWGIQTNSSYTFNNPQITQSSMIADSAVPSCSRSTGYLLANNSTTVFYYNQPLNNTKHLDCLYYASYNNNNNNYNNVLKCKSLPSISIYYNTKLNSSDPNATTTTNSYLKYDKLEKICANDNILLAMGCSKILYYLKLDNIDANNWVKCDYPIINNTSINYIGINLNLIFMYIYDTSDRANTNSNVESNTTSNTKLIYTMVNSIGSGGVNNLSAVVWNTWVEKKDTTIVKNPLFNFINSKHITVSNDICIIYDNTNYILWSCPIHTNSTTNENLSVSNNLWEKYNILSYITNNFNISNVSSDTICICFNVLYMYYPYGVISIALNTDGIQAIFPFYDNRTSIFNASKYAVSSTSVSTVPNTNTSVSTVPNTNTSVSTVPNTGAGGSSDPNTGTGISTVPNTNTSVSTVPNTGAGGSTVPSTTLYSYNTVITQPLLTRTTNYNSANPMLSSQTTNSQQNERNLYISPIDDINELYNMNRYNDYYSTHNIGTPINSETPNNPHIYNKITSSFFPLVKIS